MVVNLQSCSVGCRNGNQNMVYFLSGIGILNSASAILRLSRGYSKLQVVEETVGPGKNL